MLSNVPGKKINTYTPDYVVFDLETTGINCKSDEVIEISAVRVRGGKAVDEFSTLVNPGIPIPDGASTVNGIYDDMVADSPGFEEALKDFLEFIGDDVLVGHNIHCFDMKFIWRDSRRFWGKVVGNDYIDTLGISRAYLPEVRGHRLTDLASYYGIETDGAHRALADCRMNMQVFEALHKEMENPSPAARAIPKCPRCGSILKKRNGMYGEFWGCSGYPGCRYTRNTG